MSLKRSVRKSTRTAILCGAMVEVQPIPMGGSLNKPAVASSDKK